MKTYHDIEGDGGSRVAEQVEALEASIERALSGVRQVIAVGSGKGGVGKSTLTMALAYALNAGGHRVTILDADFNGPCQAQMAGLESVPWVPGARGIEVPTRRDGLGVVSLGSVQRRGQPMELESVSRGDEHVWRSTREFAFLGQLLAGVAWGELDFLLLDLPPGAERTVQYASFLGSRPAFLLVTIPSDLSRGVVARSLTALSATGARILGYAENMAGYLCHGCDEVRPLFPESRTELPIPRLGRIPFDPDLAARCDLGWPSGRQPQPALRELCDNLLQALED